MKYKVVSAVLLVMGVCFSLCGCGGSGDIAGRSGAVSGTSVTGSAVSGTAVEVKEESKEYKKHRFCNDTHLYYLVYTDDDDEVLVERSLADGTEHKYEMPGEFNTLYYVDNDWVYYMNEIDGEELFVFPSIFYRVPIEENEAGKQVNLEKAEILFKEEKGIYDKYTPHCDGRYMAYMQEDTFEIRKFDIQKNKYVENTGEIDEVIEGIVGEIGSKRYAIVNDDVFYLSYISDETREEDVFWYSRKDDKRKRVSGINEIKERLKEEKSEELYPDGANVTIDGIFVRKNRLYCQVNIMWTKEKVDYYNMLILSKDIRENGELELEEGLNRCLANPEKDQKVFRKVWSNAGGSSKALFLSRGECEGMTEEYAFLVLYTSEDDAVRLACYDFESGDYKLLSESDDEWYLPYYDGYHPIMDGNYYMNSIPAN